MIGYNTRLDEIQAKIEEINKQLIAAKDDEEAAWAKISDEIANQIKIEMLEGLSDNNSIAESKLEFANEYANLNVDSISMTDALDISARVNAQEKLIQDNTITNTTSVEFDFDSANAVLESLKEQEAQAWSDIARAIREYAQVLLRDEL